MHRRVITERRGRFISVIYVEQCVYHNPGDGADRINTGIVCTCGDDICFTHGNIPGGARPHI